MKRRVFIATLLLLTGAHRAFAQNDIVVIGNLPDQSLRLERHEVRNLFMGSAPVQDLVPVSMPSDHPARVLFNTKVIGLTEARVSAFWAQMKFSGRGKPPREVEDVKSLLTYISETPGAVGYVIDTVALPDNVRVLYRSH